MNNIYDVLLNFNNGIAYQFYEWNDSDLISHIKKIPIYRISDDSMKKLLTNTVKVDMEFLDSLNNRTEVFKNKKLVVINYCAIFGNNKDAIAIKFNKLGCEVARSDMVLDEKDEIIDLLNHINVEVINFSSIYPINRNTEITRYEQNNKKLLKKELYNIYINKNVSKLQYIYFEIFNEHLDSITDIYNRLLLEIDLDWGLDHEKLLGLFKLFNVKKQM